MIPPPLLTVTHRGGGGMIPPPPLIRSGEKAQKTAYVYLLKSLKTNKFYVGWTTDLKRRTAEHNSGKSYYTRTRGPWALMDYEVYNSVQDAKKRERTLKHCPRMLFLFKKRALNKQGVVEMVRHSQPSLEEVVR